MAGKTVKKQNKAVSPVNGVPTPRGKPFTSESAREAARRGQEKRAAKKSITAAFMQYMTEIVTKDEDGTPLTGAQAIAKSIIRGATKGNAEMVKIALAITGETPAVKVEAVSVVDDATREEVKALLDEIENRAGEGKGGGD